MESEILNSLLLRPGLNGKEELLLDMIRDCIEELKDMLNYKEGDALPSSLTGVVKEMVLIQFNLDGVQGIVSETQSAGGSTTYTRELPPSILKRIRRYRKLPR